MSWLNNTQAQIFLTIDGEDYTNEFIGAQLTDGSAINTGAVLTGGTIQLAELPLAVGQTPRIEDYQKSKFGRGKIVEIDVDINGVRQRHPRGYLYIIDSTYDMESRSASIEVGCLLTLHNITDDIGSLSTYTIFPLPGDSSTDTEVATFKDLLQAISAEGKFIWQKNDGTIEKRTFFDGDGLGSNKQKESWVSVRDETALGVQPLSNGSPVPDEIRVSYSWEVTDGNDDTLTIDGTDTPTEIDTTESNYFLEHPANIKKIQTICTTNPQGVRTCRDVALNAAKEQFDVTKTQTSQRIFGGPGGSVILERGETVGPAVEMAGGYFSELYAFELAREGGNPDNVTLKGLNQITQTRTERTYEYGSGGEVTKQVDRQYKHYIGAMTQNDWRAGNGEGDVFDPDSPLGDTRRGFLTDLPLLDGNNDPLMYLDRMVTTTYEYYDDRTIEFSETLTSSAACNGVGIYPPNGARELIDIGAINNGVRTTQKRTSTGGLLNPDQPPRNPGGPKVSTQSSVYVDESSKYPVTPAGAIILSTNVPYSVPGKTESEARELAANYARILRAQIEGDAAGIRVAESMRPEIFSYVPGMPFAYHDRTYDTTLKLRMNSTGWAMAPGESIFSTEGCLIGRSNGQVTESQNVDANTLAEAFKPVGQQQAVVDALSEQLAGLTDDCNAKANLMAAIDEVIASRNP